MKGIKKITILSLIIGLLSFIFSSILYSHWNKNDFDILEEFYKINSVTEMEKNAFKITYEEFYSKKVITGFEF